MQLHDNDKDDDDISIHSLENKTENAFQVQNDKNFKTLKIQSQSQFFLSITQYQI